MYSERTSSVPGGVVWRVGGASGQEQHETESVLPDGCMDIVWAGGRLLVAGPDTHAHPVDLGGGGQAAGLRFAPGTAPAVLGVAAHELVDRRVPLDEVWSSRAARRLADAVERAEPLGAAGVARALEVDVSGHPGADAGSADAVGRVAMLQMTSAGAGVQEVARATGWSERQLRRHSRDLFGYGLVTLRRVLRLQAAVRLATQGWSLAEVAAGAGYADQAHLTREVVDLTGQTPSRVLRSPRQPSGAKRSTGLPSGSRTVA